MQCWRIFEGDVPRKGIVCDLAWEQSQVNLGCCIDTMVVGNSVFNNACCRLVGAVPTRFLFFHYVTLNLVLRDKSCQKAEYDYICPCIVETHAKRMCFHSRVYKYYPLIAGSRDVKEMLQSSHLFIFSQMWRIVQRS